MAKASYRPDPKGFVEMATSPQIAAAMIAAAEAGRRYAETIAPVDTGEYRAKFRVRPGVDGSGRDRRAVAWLENTADHALYVEADHQVMQETINRIEQP